MNQFLMIAPYFSPKYLIIENGIILIQCILICIFYVKMWMEGNLPFWTAWIHSIWLFTLFALNSALVIFYILFLPQLMTLPRQKQRRKQVNQLRTLLNSRIHQYIQFFLRFLSILYFIGVLLTTCEFFFGTHTEETYYLKQFVRIATFLHITKYFLIIIPLKSFLQKRVVREQQNEFISDLKFTNELTKDVCSICYMNFKQNEEIAEYLCNGRHVYHRLCIVNWLKTTSNHPKVCPYCKQLPIDYN